MIAYPTTATQYYDDCYASTLATGASDELPVNTICTRAYRAVVQGSGVVLLRPLSTATYYKDSYPALLDNNMACKDLSAIGLLKGVPLSIPRWCQLHVAWLAARISAHNLYAQRGLPILVSAAPALACLSASVISW
jgi:hypothetical protein